MNIQSFSVKKIQSLDAQTWKRYESEIINRLYQLANFGNVDAMELLSA